LADLILAKFIVNMNIWLTDNVLGQHE